jgi:hypothetical protein
MTTERPTAEDEKPWAHSAAHEKPLEESLEDASVLLWYATREGKSVSKQSISDIVVAQSSLGAGTRNPELEGRFWAALRELGAAVKPASVDSILATYNYPFGQHVESGKRRLIDAASTKRKYSIAAIGVLICLVSFQIYWFIGTTIRTDLESHRNELDHIAGSLRAMSLNAKNLQDLINAKQQQIETEQGPMSVADSSGTMAPSSRPVTQLVEELESLKKEQDKTILDYANARKRSFRVHRMLQGDTRMMGQWDLVTRLAGSSDALGQADKGLYRPWLILGDQQLPWGEDENLSEIEKSLFENTSAIELGLLNSKSALAIFSQYVLPLLYGLLGALAYILRTLSREIQNVTFTRGSEIRYSLRWPLGMLGGVTVGLFFDPADLSGLAAITPLGLAFLAGYGVELLFTGLDRMVSAFAGEGPERPKIA